MMPSSPLSGCLALLKYLFYLICGLILAFFCLVVYALCFADKDSNEEKRYRPAEIEKSNISFVHDEIDAIDEPVDPSVLTELEVPKDIVSYTISDQKTSIGRNAFKDCRQLKEIHIPAQIKEIDAYAFEGCESLVRVTFDHQSSSLKTIAYKAFAACTSLESVEIPEGVTAIVGGFYGCTALEHVILPESLMIIGKECFTNCKSLQRISIPPNVQRLGEAAFQSCTSLRNLTIPDRVFKIDEFCFDGCSSLAEIILPNRLAEINAYLFRGCSKLKTIEFPKYLQSISIYAFDSCSSLELVIFPETLKEISNSAFANCTQLKEVTIKGNTELGPHVFRHCPRIQDVAFLGNNYVFENGIFYNPLKTVILASIPSLVRGNIQVPNGVLSLGMCALAYCEWMTDIQLPESLDHLSIEAFAYCSRLESIILPPSVTMIPAMTFRGCTSLKSVGILAPSFEFEGGFFDESPNLTTLHYRSNNLCLEDGILYDAKKKNLYRAFPALVKTHVNIPDTVTTIHSAAFAGCERVRRIYLPSSVDYIQHHAFLNCTMLREIHVPRFLRQLGSGAFAGCSNLESIDISGAPSTIEEYLFYDCHQLKSIKLPTYIKKIDAEAFSHCNNLENLQIPSSLKESNISKTAFNNCPKLKIIRR